MLAAYLTCFIDTGLEYFWDYGKVTRVAELRTAALETYSQTVCDFDNIRILLDGEGDYQPSLNAHGDPADSLPVYVNEIINAKKDSNNLNGSRPNIIMTNALGMDFQFGFPKSTDQVPAIPELPSSLDEVWIYICSFESKLETCQQVLKIRRGDYAGSSF